MKDKLIMRLSSIQFAIQEFRIYLDTHKDDVEAQEMYESYKKKYKVLKDEYEKEYGPLTLNGKNSDEWLKDPWPWD